MKVYKIELMFIDFDDLGQEETKDLLENVRLPNHIVNPDVMSIEERDIGEWDDNNPLNCPSTATSEFRRLFKS